MTYNNGNTEVSSDMILEEITDSIQTCQRKPLCFRHSKN